MAMSPTRAIKNVTIPKEGDKSPILSPPAKTPVEISVVSVRTSRALISPMKNPKNPQNNANKLICFTRFVFLPLASPFASVRAINTTQIIRASKVVYIKRGPPSFSKFANKNVIIVVFEWIWFKCTGKVHRKIVYAMFDHIWTLIHNLKSVFGKITKIGHPSFSIWILSQKSSSFFKI